MKLINNDTKNVIIEVPIEEIRALLGILNEALEGPYSLTEEEWEVVSVHPRELDHKLLTDLDTIIAKYDAINIT